MAGSGAELVASRRHLTRSLLRLAQVTFVGLYLSLTIGGAIARNVGMLMLNRTTARPLGPSAYWGTWRSLAVENAWLLVLAACVLATERLLLRWIVPALQPGCPACGHDASGLARCPECGLDLAPPEPPARGA